MVRPFMMVGKTREKQFWVEVDKSRVFFRQLILRCPLDIHVENDGFQDSIEWMNTEPINILCNSQLNQDMLKMPRISGVHLTRLISRKKLKKIEDIEGLQNGT